MVTLEDYESRVKDVAWCPGCGNFPILDALKQALVELNLEPWQVAMVSGIGQSSKLPHYLRVSEYNELHGRLLPAATGLSLANHELVVIGVGGDGDGYGEGGNHWINAIRRNPNMMYMVTNNQIYGLTKGQASPTTDYGMKTKDEPVGIKIPPMNPLAMAIALDCSFVARSFAGDVDFTKEILKKAITHKGFAFVDILQPCVTWNKLNTYQWYRERVYKLGDDYNPTDKLAAFQKSQEWGEKIPIGVISLFKRPILKDDYVPLQKGTLVDLQKAYNPSQFKDLLKKFF
jgi:2-oxoglutarate ferredoxin oxidoreductase subunit beta